MNILTTVRVVLLRIGRIQKGFFETDACRNLAIGHAKVPPIVPYHFIKNIFLTDTCILKIKWKLTMNKRIILTIGGILNSLFALFHVYLVYVIMQFDNLTAGYKALMIMLGVGGTLMIAFLAWASLRYRDEMLNTRLGNAVIALSVLVYLTRALEEIWIAPVFSFPIFIACLAVSVIYLFLLMKSDEIMNN
jgi:hypothetical protein